MRKFLLLSLLLPLLMTAQQPVKPVISEDYLSLVAADSARPVLDSSKNLLRLRQPYSGSFPLRAIRVGASSVTLIPAKNRWLTLGGTFNTSFGARSAGRHPDMQEEIFRTGFVNSQSLTLQGHITGSWPLPWAFSLKVGKSSEDLILADNRNTSHNVSISVERFIKKLVIGGGYSYFSSHFTNDNSNGFLNSFYQRPLKGGHPVDRTQQTASLSIQQKQGDFTFGLINGLDAVDENGIRKQNDRHYSSNAWMGYRFHYNDDNDFTSTARLSYIYNDEDVRLINNARLYTYHRSSSDAALTFNSVYDNGYTAVGLNTGTKLYASNTSASNRFFLPEISGFVSSNRLFDFFSFAKLAATYTSFCSEPAINHFLSGFLLTQLTPQEAYHFMPLTEVGTFKVLSPMRHQELTAKLTLDYRGRFYFYGDYSIRNTKDNVFPVYDNNQLLVKNMADTRYKGFELQLGINTGSYKGLRLNNSLSFYKFTNIVTRVEDGYDYHPIAGFSTVYKALVKGKSVGVIVGGNGHLILGDPTPDYTLKLSHSATWKAFAMNLDWEYRKGGDMWNGAAPTPDIQKADNLRIHNLSMSYDVRVKRLLQQLRLTAYAQNLLLWSAYKGVDPNQLLYDQPGTSGLDFFNLPSAKTYGVSATIKF